MLILEWPFVWYKQDKVDEIAIDINAIFYYAAKWEIYAVSVIKSFIFKSNINLFNFRNFGSNQIVGV